MKESSQNHQFPATVLIRWAACGRVHPWLVSLCLMTGCFHVRREDPLDWTQWKVKRLESVAGEAGWSTLVGLFWLVEGAQSMGSDRTNDLRLPPDLAAPTVGRFIRTGEEVRFEAAPGVIATCDGHRLSELVMVTDADGARPSEVTVGDLRFFVIRRDGRLAVRLKSPLAATRREFKGLEYFPYDPQWRILARLEANQGAATIPIADVTGGVQQEPSPGILVFQFKGREWRLVTLDDDETHDLWVVFRDESSGHSTYGGGRFLHAAKPGSDGKVWVDFNFAYSPPCAFTPFATCPLPPSQNRLEFPVLAGEKKYRGGHE